MKKTLLTLLLRLFSSSAFTKSNTDVEAPMYARKSFICSDVFIYKIRIPLRRTLLR